MEDGGRRGERAAWREPEAGGIVSGGGEERREEEERARSGGGQREVEERGRNEEGDTGKGEKNLGIAFWNGGVGE